MRNAVKRILKPFLEKYYRIRTKRTITYRFNDLKIAVFPGVFAPIFTFSTKLLLEEIYNWELKGKSLLELGCGSGAVAVLAAKKGAEVTASDINPKAVENAQANALNNQVKITTIQSDLFQSVPQKQFDYIVINPPYYPSEAKNNEEKAWYCGEDFDYFKQLSNQLGAFIQSNTQVVMILSEDCEIDLVKDLFEAENLELTLMKELNKYKEKNFLFSITKAL